MILTYALMGCLSLGLSSVKLANSQSEFCWEQVNFGLKATLRIVQQVIYRGASPGSSIKAMPLKQLYASHYFQTALDLPVCVKNAARPNESGFYLVAVKVSKQALGGFS